MDTDEHTTARTARLEARVTKTQKALFQRAAALSGRSVTDFVVGSAQDAANRAIREREIMTVAGNDRERLVEALLNPPEPGQRLRKAARHYRKSANSS
jgi:uncharacterized protein (DUF1778 family)